MRNHLLWQPRHIIIETVGFGVVKAIASDGKGKNV